MRFSCEDSFRSDPSDLLKIYKAVDDMGVDRVGIADTVGVVSGSKPYFQKHIQKHVCLCLVSVCLPAFLPACLWHDPTLFLYMVQLILWHLPF